MAENNQPGLAQKIQTMSDKFNFTPIKLNANTEKTFISNTKQCIRNAVIDHQLRLLKTNSILMEFYTTFKNDTRKADFLDMIKNPQHRIAINKLRLGNQHLQAGRHSVPNTPENLRLCYFYQTNDV